MSEQPIQRNIGLDLVRAIAILMVLISHTRHILHSNSELFGENLWRLSIGGYYGVELFFVLSGFLIGRILIQNLNNKKGGNTKFVKTTLIWFWIRRWFRTLPLYFLMLIVNCVLYYYLHDCNNIIEIPINWRHFVFLQNYDTAALSFFPEAWSLSVEEWFYLLVPVILYCSKKYFNSLFYGVISVIFFTSLARFIFVYSVGAENIAWDEAIRKNIFLRLDALAIGLMFAFISIKWPRIFSMCCSPLALLVALLGLGYNMFLFLGSKDFLNCFYAKTFMFNCVSLSWGLFMCYMYKECMFQSGG